MKLKQKLRTGLLLIGLLSAVVFGVASNAPRASADTATCTYAACSQTDVTSADGTYTFNGISRITATFGGKKITFTDPNPYDSTHKYYPPAGTFCSGLDGQGGIDFAQTVIGPSTWPDNISQNPMGARADIDWYFLD